MSSKIVIDNVSGEVLVDGSPLSGGMSSAPGAGYTFISDSSNQWVEQATSLSWRNKIINGDMRVAQRGTAAVTLSSGTYVLDRFQSHKSASWTALVATSQQSTDAPTGFTNSLLYTVSTGNTTAVGYSAYVVQNIEGSTVYDLGWGTANAKTVTISFWVKSSVTGTYSIALRNAAANRSYVAEYSITTADWERKVITVPGDTTGVWETGSDSCISLFWTLRAPTFTTSTLGSWQASGAIISTDANALNFTGTSSRTFRLTGVQLEVGSVATPFETLQYEKQLELCQRYFARLSSVSGNYVGFASGCSFQTNAAFVYLKYPQQMRSAPTISQSNTAIFNTTVRAFSAFGGGTSYGSDSVGVVVTTAATTQTIGQAVVWTGNNNASAYVDLNAEL